MTEWVLSHQDHLFVALMLMLAMAAVTVVFDMFQPKDMPNVVARKIIFLINVPVGFNVSYALWTSVHITGLDNGAKFVVCAIVSVLAAAATPYYHRWAFALIKWKFPTFDIPSAFAKEPPP